MITKDNASIIRQQTERRTIDEGIAIWKNKRKLETLLEAEDKKLWEMLATYNPWGKPGHGAPMPGAFRKTKWIFDDPNEVINPYSVTTLGRPGHGAPMRTPTGQPNALVRSDPLLRFQMHNLARAAVENGLRYKSTPHEKENYRRELDSILYQKKKANEMENTEKSAARDHNGWTNDMVFKNMERNKGKENEREHIYEISGGGVELVPLLAKHRIVTKCPLTTTDITKISRLCKNPGSTPPEYFKQLYHQVQEKKQQKLQEEKEETMQSSRHFQTWQGFWGRPGHGAPKALSQREKLDVLLYRMPSQRINSYAKKQV